MMDEKIIDIPSEKFTFVNKDTQIHDKKLDTKPIGYMRDALRRFCKSKAAVVAFAIIVLIVLFSLFMPLFTSYDSTFLDTQYAKKGPRNLALSKIGLATGTVTQECNERILMKYIGIGIAAEDYDGKHSKSSKAGLDSAYQPFKKIKSVGYQAGNPFYKVSIDEYLVEGFRYVQVSQEEYKRICDWQDETGIRVTYPLIADNEYMVGEKLDANCWYKATGKLVPVKVNASGTAVPVSYNGGDFELEDNYMRDGDGNPVYWVYQGGGSSAEMAEYKIRVLYYNYYRYKNGFEPQYIFGTDAQGYDLALRLAGGIKLSLIVAIVVSLINLVIGAIYGAIEGYYGGAVDLILERISDILSGMPFIVLATLFQLHLASKVGAIPSLLFAFVVTGWIGMASRVRTQFYRFKTQEYVLAARTLGARDSRIIWKHIFPNSLGTIITSCALVIPGVIFDESMLSFLGIVSLGGAEMTSLGTMLSEASTLWTLYPHLMIFPALVISLLMICFNLFGNGLRDAFNPSLRGAEG